MQKLWQRLFRKCLPRRKPRVSWKLLQAFKKYSKEENIEESKKKVLSVFEKGFIKENRLHVPTWIWPECPQHRNSGMKKCINSPRE